MGDHDDRLAGGVDRFKQPQKRIGSFGVERSGRLIGEDQLRVRNQRTGNGGALFLTARNLVGVFFHQIGDSQHFGDRDQPFLHLPVFFPLQNKGKEDVVAEGKGVQKVKILKNKAEIIPPEGRKRLFGKGGKLDAV